MMPNIVAMRVIALMIGCVYLSVLSFLLLLDALDPHLSYQFLVVECRASLYPLVFFGSPPLSLPVQQLGLICHVHYPRSIDLRVFLCLIRHSDRSFKGVTFTTL